MASRSSCSANRGTASGSSRQTCRRVSAAAWIDAAGVFNSCDALATKSRRTASSVRDSVTSPDDDQDGPVVAGRGRRGPQPSGGIADLELGDLVAPGRRYAPDRLSKPGREHLPYGVGARRRGGARVRRSRTPSRRPRRTAARPPASSRGSSSWTRRASVRRVGPVLSARCDRLFASSSSRSRAWKRSSAEEEAGDPADPATIEPADEASHQAHRSQCREPARGRTPIRRSSFVRLCGDVHLAFIFGKRSGHPASIALRPDHHGHRRRGTDVEGSDVRVGRRGGCSRSRWSRRRVQQRRQRRRRERSGGGDLTGSLNISGSSTVEPITSLVAENFHRANPGVDDRRGRPGHQDGFALFCNGETDINDASRQIDGGRDRGVQGERGRLHRARDRARTPSP